MARFSEASVESFESGTTISTKYLRVRLSSGVLALAGASDTDGLGQAEGEGASGDTIPVRLSNAPGFAIGVCNAAFAIGDTVYAAASGKVAPSGTVVLGEALTATAADGEYVTFLPSKTTINALARTSLTEDALQPYGIPLAWLRVWDAPATVAVGTPANDDLGIVYNTVGTAAPSVESGDLKNAGSTTRKVGFQFVVPVEYVAGEDVTIRLKAGMKTTVASTAATIDVNAYRAADPTVDICATAAQDINSLTAANKDFVLTDTNIVPGDIIDVVVSILVNDTGTGTAVIGKWYIGESSVKCDIKG